MSPALNGLLRLALLACLASTVACDRKPQAPAGAPEPAAAPALSTLKEPLALKDGERWNLLLFTLDTCRADVLKELGAKRMVAPRMEELASQGVLWTRAETVTPLTLPAHCSIMTGLYPGAHGVRHNARYALSPSHPTIATVLRNAGYETAAFIASYPLAPEFGTNQGFDVYDASFERNKGIESERSASAVNAKVLPWIAGRHDKPFFAWVHYFDAHDPYVPPEPFKSRFADAPYLGEVATVDAALGDVLAALAKAGTLDRTLVVIAGDHGEGLGEHGEAYHGLLLHGATTHVPVVFWGGPLARKSRELDFPASLTDIMPTTLALLGVPAPEGVQGLDLSQQLQGKGDAPGRAGAISETWYGYLEFGWSPLRSIRAPEHRYVEAPAPELYDLRKDPAELTNIATAQLDKAGELRDELLRQEAATRNANASANATQQMTQQELEALQSLGYVASGGVTAVDTATIPKGPDVKDMMPLFEQYNRARARLEGGDPAGALALLDPLIAKDPANAQFHGKRAKALAYLGRVADAEAEWRAMIAKDPRDVQSYWDLSILFDLAGRQRDAIAVLRDLQKVEPAYVGLVERVATMHAMLGETPEALALLEKAPDAGAEQQAGERLALAGVIALRAGDGKRAVALLEKAQAATPPGDVPAWQLAAARALAAGKNGEALLALKGEAQAHGDELAAWSLLCSEAVRQGSSDLAASACTTLTSMRGHEPRDQALLVRALLMAGRADEAQQRSAQLLRGNPGWWWVHRAWAEHDAGRGEREAATKAYEAWLALDPGSKDAAAGLARLKSGRR